MIHSGGILACRAESMKKQRLVRPASRRSNSPPMQAVPWRNSLRYRLKSRPSATGRYARPAMPGLETKAAIIWAGTLGAAMMSVHRAEMGGKSYRPGSRVVNFTRNGEKRFAELFGKKRIARRQRNPSSWPGWTGLQSDLPLSEDVDARSSPGQDDKQTLGCLMRRIFIPHDLCRAAPILTFTPAKAAESPASNRRHRP